MSFLYPGFLIALAALIIPIIIHLFNFRRFKTVYFTNVRFLREIQEETATKNKLKHLLILLSRLLAIAFLVFAFAQPFIPKKDVEVSRESRAVSIYIDNSFSMDARDSETSLLDEAKIKAGEIAEAFGNEDRFQLLTNDFEGKHQRLVNKEEFISFLDEVELSPSFKTLSQVVKRQGEVLKDSELANVSSYLLSDFQENITDINEDTTLNIYLIPLKSQQRRNVSIDSAWFLAPVQTLNMPNQLMVKITNYGEEDLSNSRLTLTINDQIKALSDYDLPSLGTITDTINFTVTDKGWQNAELSITDYPISFDDTYFLSFEVSESVPVLVISEEDPNPYLKNIFGDSESFSLVNNRSRQIDYAAFPTYNLIVLNSLRSISSGLSAQLAERLEAGANVLIFPALDMDKDSYNNFLRTVNAGQIGPLVSRKRDVVFLNTEIGLLKDVFEGIPKNMSLPSASRSYDILTGTYTTEESLMKFKDDKSFMSKFSVGNGSLFLSASSLDKEVTDLPVQGAILVPLLYKIAVTGNSRLQIAYTIGRDQWLSVNNAGLSAESIFKVKNESIEFIPEQRPIGDRLLLNLSSQIRESGTYEVFLPGDAFTEYASMNYDRKESETSYLDADELEERYGDSRINVIKSSDQNLASLVGEFNQGIRLWKLCLILALVFLAAEVLLIRIFR